MVAEELLSGKSLSMAAEISPMTPKAALTPDDAEDELVSFPGVMNCRSPRLLCLITKMTITQTDQMSQQQ